MNEWINEWMNELMNEIINERVNDLAAGMNERLNGKTEINFQRMITNISSYLQVIHK